MAAWVRSGSSRMRSSRRLASVGNMSARSMPCSSISSMRGSGARNAVERLHRLAEELPAVLPLGVAHPEVLLHGARAGHHVEGRVGDVVADLPADDDLRAPPHLDVVDGALVPLGEVLGEGVPRLVQVVVGVEDHGFGHGRDATRHLTFASITSRRHGALPSIMAAGVGSERLTPMSEPRGGGGCVDRGHGRRPGPGGGRAHLRAGRIGAPRRLGRRDHQDRARRAGRRHARPRLERHRVVRRRRARAARALEPGQEEHRARSHLRGRPRHPLPLAATCDVFLTNKLPSVRTQAEDRPRRHPGPQPGDHLRARHTARATRAPTPTAAPTTAWRSGAGPASRSASSPPDPEHVTHPPAPGLRRLHRRDDDRRRDHGRAVPPGAHGRDDRGRRVAARRGPVVDGRGARPVPPDERPVAGHACRAPRRATP